MQTDHSVQGPSHHIDREIVIEPEGPISISHFTHVLRNYRQVILLAIASILLAYLIVAVAIYLFSPVQRVTSQPFRLDFEGAGKGEYPNRTKFNIADIINGPILARVWKDSRLGDFIGFGEFSRAVYVLESNPQYDLLAAEYQAKLADSRISPIDRERLQKEFELKKQSIAKNDYSINLDRRGSGRSIPEPLARKVLLDILNGWADFAVNQQHVIAYQVSVLSPEIVKPSAIEQNDPVAAIEVLRAKTNRVISNINKIEILPGATLARTPGDHQSLEEIKIRIDDIMRFRLEPLLAVVLHSPSLIGDRAGTVRFLESQLAYDQRQLEAMQRLADSFRGAMAIYEQRGSTEDAATNGGTSKQPGDQLKGNESVMPQLSDTFLDRLMTIAGRAGDAEYRQGLVDLYRRSVAETIPLQQAVTYDTQVLDDLRKPSTSTSSLDRAAVHAQIEQTRSEVAQLIGKMNELFQVVSSNMTPSTQLFALTGSASTRTFRGVNPQRLALYGLLILLLSIPAVIILCLLHNRVREEETAGEYLRQERAAS
jgi:hypothetical protein